MKGGLNYNETKFVDAKVKKLIELITNLTLTIPPHQRCKIKFKMSNV